MPPTHIRLNTMPDSPPTSSVRYAPSSNGVVRSIDTIARAVLMGFFMLLPVFLIPAAWATLAQSKVLFTVCVTVLVAFAWAVARLTEGAVHTPRSILLYVAFLLPLAYVVSTAVSGWNSTSIVGLGTEQDTLVAVVMWFALFALTTILFAEKRSAIRACMRAFSIGLLALVAFETLYVFFPSISFDIVQGPTGNPLGSWHDLGILSGLAFFFSIALFRSGLFNGLWRIVPILVGPLSLFLLIVIHFQDVFWGVAALSLAGCITVIRATFQAEGGSLTEAVMRALPWFVVGVAMVLLALMSAQVADRLPERIQIAEVEVRPSWQGTFDVARQSLGAPTSLLFGSGPNSFIREWGLHKPQSVNLTPFWNSDFNYGIGVIPTSVFAVGLFGLLAWAAILLVLIGLLFRFIRDVRPLTAGRTLFGALAIAVAYLVTFHMIYTPGVAVTGITFLLLALLAVAAAGDSPSRTWKMGIASVANILVLIGLLLFVAVTIVVAGFAGREVTSNLFVNRGAYVYRTAQDVGTAGRLIERSLVISPNNDRAHRAATELGIVELAQLLARGNAESEEARAQLQETLQNTIQHGLTAVSINSTNYQNWLSLAQLYADLAGVNVEGALDNAKNAYERAFEAQPTNPIPKLRLAQLAVAQGDLADARANVQEAIELKPDFAAGYYLLSQVEAAAGEGDAAVTAAAQAVQLVPDDPLGWFNLGYLLYSGGVYADAAAALERAAVLAPDYSNALFILGLSYHYLDRTDDAVAVLSRVAELNGSETWLQALIANVREHNDPFAGLAQPQ